MPYCRNAERHIRITQCQVLLLRIIQWRSENDRSPTRTDLCRVTSTVDSSLSRRITNYSVEVAQICLQRRTKKVRLMSKSDFTHEEQETVRKSKESWQIITADTTEEATAYVKDSDMFITVQLLEDSLAVLSLENMSFEWKEGQPTVSRSTASRTNMHQ